MRFDLATLVKAANPRAKSKTLRPIRPTRAMASDLAAINRLPADRWLAGFDRVVAVYERSLSGLTTDTADDLAQTLDALGAEVNAVLLLLTPRMRLWAERASRWHLGKWTANVLSAANVQLDTLLSVDDTRETVATVLNRNLALVSDTSDVIRGRWSDIVFRGLTARTPARVVAKELREVSGLQRARSVRVASDQLTKLTSALDEERMRQAGLERYRWQHSGKRNPRADHLARDGNIYKLGEPADSRPGQLPYCGCQMAPCLDLD